MDILKMTVGECMKDARIKAIVEKHHGTISAVNTATGLDIIMCFPHIDGYQTI